MFLFAYVLKKQKKRKSTKYQLNLKDQIIKNNKFHNMFNKKMSNIKYHNKNKDSLKDKISSNSNNKNRSNNNNNNGNRNLQLVFLLQTF